MMDMVCPNNRSSRSRWVHQSEQLNKQGLTGQGKGVLLYLNYDGSSLRLQEQCYIISYTHLVTPTFTKKTEMIETTLGSILVVFEQGGYGLNLSLFSRYRRLVSGCILGRAERSCKMH